MYRNNKKHKEDVQKQVQDLMKKAEEGVKSVFESERYRQYLTVMSRFHDYSFRNTLLICLQKPQASQVAGFVDWQKKFNRHVRKGEEGIQIIGYTPKNVVRNEEKKDASGNTILDEHGKPVTEAVTHKIPCFKPVYVYDVSQTEGDPLPQIACALDGSVEKFDDFMKALREVSPFPITFENLQGGAYGYCSPNDKKIVVKKGLSEAQTVKTTIHEITHADLHVSDNSEKKDRSTKEVEAESTAFIVCSHYGIDTSDYSFGYLAAWSSGKELKELQGSLDTIQKQANDLIGRLDERLEVLQKERNPQRRETRAVRTSILDRLQTAKQAVTQCNNLGSQDLSQPAIETEAR